ncbi:MAG: DUF1996 domain-containing protein [Desulfurellales bacterium]|nr:MAG: DUF1996 domain-containing protein [Desulfurellales bacterium]
MKKLISILCALMWTNVALAQSFPKPPDVPDYVPVTVTYQPRPGTNQLGDGSNAKGGTPPAYASQPADIPATTTTGWVVNTSISGNFCDLPPSGGTCAEAKARFVAETSHISADDPIRNYCQPGMSHLHQFFGNRTTNACSTFASLRNNANAFKGASTFGGGIVNGTAYWFPCPIKTNPFSNGKNYCVKSDYQIIYYTENPYNGYVKLNRIPRSLRYVTGHRMDAPGSTGYVDFDAEIAAANAQSGTGGRYYRVGRGTGWIGWGCESTGESGKRYLGKKDGSAGGFTTPCPSSSRIYAEIIAPQCWDGVNLWSPGGYKHFRHAIGDNDTGAQDICPNGWYRIPQLILKIFFTHQGEADYKTWRLSSDDTAEVACGGCTIENGESFHTDWFGAWDDAIFMAWQDNCLGVNATPHECNYSVISATQRLITDSAAPDGSRTPQQVNLTNAYGTTLAANMWEIPSSYNGPKTLHSRGP